MCWLNQGDKQNEKANRRLGNQVEFYINAIKDGIERDFYK